MAKKSQKSILRTILGILLLVVGIILVAPFALGAVKLFLGILALVVGWSLANGREFLLRI